VDSLSNPLERLSFEVTIGDANKNTWQDKVSINAFQSSIILNGYSESANIKGYLIVPGHQLIDINTQLAEIKVPYQPDKRYKIVLSNPPNLQDETFYSIGIAQSSNEDFSALRDTSIFEPNNSESQETVLQLEETIQAYLHVGDIDYFAIDMGNYRSIVSDLGLQITGSAPYTGQLTGEDRDGDTLTWLVGEASKGVVSVDETGVYSYVPNDEASFDYDEFEYWANDGKLDSAKGTILLSTLTVSIADISVDEGASTAELTVSLNKISDIALSVNYQTEVNSANSPDDFSDSKGSVNFAVGEQTKIIRIPVMDDGVDEANEDCNRSAQLKNICLKTGNHRKYRNDL
jgi:hypothetical protein